ncbi:hypothetical protein ZHAS_00014885 [Anopheles sinensis]|uniref:Uncharacterized protein n=1 Tax=Anopheles sinensis TaxID=74873 RepID=A0A084W9I6_ANOSI|nr:hypothetical protein ZHAS_00014885 [Anopheles sinensis]
MEPMVDGGRWGGSCGVMQSQRWSSRFLLERETERETIPSADRGKWPGGSGHRLKCAA